MAHGNSNTMRHFLRSYFAGWQAPFMAQPAHPQPQDDFPFLLLRTMLAIDTATARSRIALMMIVAIFPIIHVSIGIPLFLRFYDFTVFSFMFVVSFVASL